MDNNEIIQTDIAEPVIENTGCGDDDIYRPKGLAAVLDKFFRFSKRGSTMKKEILAGLSVFLISVCVLLVNTRIVCSSIDASNAEYCGTYLAATLISFLGTMAMGLICRLPLIQISSLGLSTAFISLIGANNGLTYANLLAVSFIGALIYCVLVCVPVLKNLVFKSLPECVRNALPVAMGLYIIYFALSSMGIVTVSGGSISIFDSGSLLLAEKLVLISVAVTVMLFLLFKTRKAKMPFLFSFIIGLVFFFAVCVIVDMSIVFTVDRGYIAVGAENMYSIAAGFEGLDFGAVFTGGFDFSSYTESVPMLFISGALVFCFMGMYESGANMQAAADEGGMDIDEKTYNRVLMVNAVTNAVAPLFGSTPVTVGKQSVIATGDGGKTGLTAVICGVGYFLASLTWIFFAMFATYTATVTEYGHAVSNSFAEYAQAEFALSNAIMLMVGFTMMNGIKKCNVKSYAEFLPFIATAAITVFTQNIVYGVAAGVIFYVLLKLFSFKPETIKSIGLPTAVLAVIMLVILLLI